MMTSKTYLPKIFHTIFLTIIFLSTIAGKIIFLSLLVFIYGLAVLLFWKKQNPYKESLEGETETLLTPVTGQVLDVFKGPCPLLGEGQFDIIRIGPYWWSDMGVYSPMKGVIEQVCYNEGNTFWRMSKNRPYEKCQHISTSILLRASKEHRLVLDLVRCPTGGFARSFLAAGDQVQGQVNIGHFPFGGTVLLYLVPEFEILVKKEDKLVVGETILAAYNNDNQS